MPPAETPRRPSPRPSLLSPSPRSGFFAAAAAAADHDAAADDEQPSVELKEWWLATVEGDAQKIAVAGTFRLNRRLYQLLPTPIAKRHAPNILESEDGTILLLSGSLNNLRMLGEGYSDTVCQHFMVGFPRWWQSCNLHYPKLMNSDTGCQPDHNKTRVACSKNQGSRAKNQHRTSNKKPVGRPKKQKFSHEKHSATRSHWARSPVSHAAIDEEMTTSVYLDVQNTLSMSNGTPILEEYTCDRDIPTNEGIPSRERGHDDIANDVSLAPTVQCTNNAVSEAVDSTPATDHNRTPVACLKNQGVMVGKVYKRHAKTSGENRHKASNKKPVGQPKKQKFSHEKHQSATRSHETRSPVSQILWSPLTRGKATSLSMSTPEDLKLKRTKSGRLVVPRLNEGCQFIVYGKDRSITGVIGLDSPAMPKGSEFKTYQRKKRGTK